MSFTQFIKPYPDGYEDFEVGGTPVTAEILNTNYDGFLLALNEFLPELAGMVEANPSESATAGNLTKLKVGNSIYLIPSGGSGGSSVEWEQIQLTGTKIATITIDNVPVDVYAPSGGGSGDEVSWNQVVSSGTKIGTITINGIPTDVYAPTPIDVEANPSGSATAGDLTKLKVGSSIYSIPSGGSGGASDLSDLDDVSITNVQNGQTIKWNSTTLKWENSNESGGGTGGHTIIDENGNSMTARAGLQFVGADVSDDATNNKTIVDLASAGGIDGVFPDFNNVIVAQTNVPSSDIASWSYTATEDCVIYISIQNAAGQSAQVRIDGKNVVQASGSYAYRATAFTALKKGQVVTVTGNVNTDTNTQYAVYGIQTGTTHSKFQPVIYSTEEREIGVWIDGKPLYEKTWDFGSDIVCTSNSWTDTPITKGDIEKIVNVKAVNTAGTIWDMLGANTDQTYIQVYHNRGSNNVISIRYTTLQYTKSSDTAGSGSWTPQGVPTHKYSTEEHIIGTWIDGSTLYEKTFYIHDRQFNSSGECDFDVISLNSDILMADNMASYYTFSISSTEYTRQFEKLVPEEGHVYAYGPANRQIETGYITIRYTKSS